MRFTFAFAADGEKQSISARFAALMHGGVCSFLSAALFLGNKYKTPLDADL
jgi:hypothetical protein